MSLTHTISLPNPSFFFVSLSVTSCPLSPPFPSPSFLLPSRTYSVSYFLFVLPPLWTPYLVLKSTIAVAILVFCLFYPLKIFSYIFLSHSAVTNVMHHCFLLNSALVLLQIQWFILFKTLVWIKNLSLCMTLLLLTLTKHKHMIMHTPTSNQPFVMKGLSTFFYLFIYNHFFYRLQLCLQPHYKFC